MGCSSPSHCCYIHARIESDPQPNRPSRCCSVASALTPTPKAEGAPPASEASQQSHRSAVGPSAEKAKILSCPRSPREIGSLKRQKTFARGAAHYHDPTGGLHAKLTAQIVRLCEVSQNGGHSRCGIGARRRRGASIHGTRHQGCSTSLRSKTARARAFLKASSLNRGCLPRCCQRPLGSPPFLHRSIGGHGPNRMAEGNAILIQV